MSQWGNNDNAANSVSYAIDIEKANGGNTSASATQTTMFGNTTANGIKTGETVGQFGVSQGEQQAARAAGASKPAHSGWVVRRVGSGGRAGRVTYETLVACKISGDAEDAVFEDYTILIQQHPQNLTANDSVEIEFSVVAVTEPQGGTITYQWEANTGSGFANVDGIGGTSGNTTATLTANTGAFANGDQFRVVLNIVGGDEVTSNPAVLTIE